MIRKLATFTLILLAATNAHASSHENDVREYFRQNSFGLGSIVELQVVDQLPADPAAFGVMLDREHSGVIVRDLYYVRTSASLLCRIGLGYDVSPLIHKNYAARPGLYAECIAEDGAKVPGTMRATFQTNSELLLIQGAAFDRQIELLSPGAINARAPGLKVNRQTLLTHLKPQLLFYLDQPRVTVRPKFEAIAKLKIEGVMPNGTPRELEIQLPVWSLEPPSCGEFLGEVAPPLTLGQRVLAFAHGLLKR